jgi:hypothetical protein
LEKQDLGKGGYMLFQTLGFINLLFDLVGGYYFFYKNEKKDFLPFHLLLIIVLTIYLPMQWILGVQYFMIANIITGLIIYLLTALGNGHSLVSSIFWGTCVNTLINVVELGVLPIIYLIAPNHQIDLDNTYVALWLYGLTYLLKVVSIFVLKRIFFREINELSTETVWYTKVIGLVFVIFSSLPFVVLGLDVYRLKVFGMSDIIIIVTYAFLTFSLLYYLKNTFRSSYNFQRLALEKAIIESEIVRFKRKSEWDEKVNILHHDLRNHFLAINSLLKDKKYEEIQKYLDKQIILSNSPVEESYCENSVLNYFLVEKKKIADELGILFSIDTRIPSDVELPLEVFSVILGNTLDNAINASTRLPIGVEKKIDLKVKESNGNLIIKISNTFDRQEIITRKKRKEKEGIGRKSIDEYVSRMGGMYREEEDGDTYNVEIILFNLFPKE